jgi:hypothetical protein
MIRGIATRDMSEGMDRQMLQVFEVTAKQRHKTPGGASEEMPVLTEFDMQAVEPYFRKMIEQKR